MPVRQRVVDVAGILLLLALGYGIALVVRRRLLARNGGTFELSYRVRTDRPGRGWILGLGRYSGETLEWFRLFALAPAERSWPRVSLSFDGRREPFGAEQMTLYPDHLVIHRQILPVRWSWP